MFKVPEEYKRQMKVVMYYEYSSMKDGQETAESSVMEEYHVCEEDDWNYSACDSDIIKYPSDTFH